MTFLEQSTGIWKATDKADTYDIIRGADKVKGTIFAAFKNRIIPIAYETSLLAAVEKCEIERDKQEWFSNNPENAEKNKQARDKRDENRPKSNSRWHTLQRKRPRLYKGRTNRGE